MTRVISQGRVAGDKATAGTNDATDMFWESIQRSCLLSSADVARMLGCTEKHVRHMHRCGEMPSSVAGFRHALCWTKPVIAQWIANGCPLCVRRGGRRRRRR